ncbi:MAG: alpha/beta fold hydrolase [Geminicoccaceae bacterium]
MALVSIDERNGLYVEHRRPQRSDAQTFVFVNALTGSTDAWEAVVAPSLRARGFGTLSYNFRGQDGSPFDPALALTPELIVGDLQMLLQSEAPDRPLLVGLSIGGLFAAQAVLAGSVVHGLVLLNTLREIGPRIAWVNDAMPVIVKAGGVSLFLDALLPLLVNQDYTAQAREKFFKGDYEGLSDSHGHMNLMRHAGQADWDIAYEKLSLPVLVITGLEDRVFLDHDVVDALFQRLPDARREDWAGAGHLLPQEAPDKLAASLAAFATAIGT